MDLGHMIEKYEKLVRKNGNIIFLQGKYFQKTVQPVAKNLKPRENIGPPLVSEANCYALLATQTLF